MKKITVVGSGTAGSLASAFLAKEFPQCTVEMIHSEKVGIIGVGESITPHLPGLLRHLGVDEKKFMRETSAVFKYGNSMENWTNKPDSLRNFYWSNTFDKPHTWSNVQNTTPSDLKTSDVWLDVYKEGSAPDLDHYHSNSEVYQYCKDLKMPFDDDGNYLIPATATYAYHIDAEKTSPWIRENVCKKYGVIETIAHVESIRTNESGIESVTLDNGRVVSSDIWVDCTGLSRLLISSLTDEVHLYKNNKVNSAVVAPIEYIDKSKEQVNYTRSIANEMGWTFSIALNDRIGTGLVYSDEHFMTHDSHVFFTAANTSRLIREPRHLHWTPMRMRYPHRGNCYAIGMAAGFIDPLEANAVVSAISCMKHLVWGIQRGYGCDYYNDKICYYLDDIAAFTSVHYTLSTRDDNDFWKEMREIGVRENHREMVREKYYETANSISGVVGYETAFPDVTWLDIANNWDVDVSEWEIRSTLEQRQEYIMNERRKKWFHRSNSYRNKKSIGEFMSMMNDVDQYEKGLSAWPDQYFEKMFDR